MQNRRPRRFKRSRGRRRHINLLSGLINNFTWAARKDHTA
jgi:hypothetical protein